VNDWSSNDSTAGVIPWVCLADGLLGGLILLLIVGLTTAGTLTLTENRNRDLEEKLVRSRQLLLELERELARKKDESRELQARLSGVEARLEVARRAQKLAEQRNRLKTERDQAEAHVRNLIKERDKLDRSLRFARTEVKRLTKEQALAVASTRKWQQEAQKWRKETASRPPVTAVAALSREVKQLQAELKSRPMVHQELLGVKGRLKRVVILLDHSGSMNIETKIGAGQQKSRWDYCKGIVRTWVRHLDMEECVLIVFSRNVTIHPLRGKGPQKTFQVKASPADRKKLTDLLDELPRPRGATNTLEALEQAYRIPDVTAMILFTDGRPEMPGESTEQLQNKVLALIEREKKAPGRDLPINTVGLGNYYAEKGLCEFLLRVADSTGGVFIGR